MPKIAPEFFPFVAKVRRTVVDTVSLNVKAMGEDEARLKAEYALHKFPASHDMDDIVYMYIENRDTLDTQVDPESIKTRKG